MTVNAADTAWVLMSGAFVLLMTPGLAMFYGGMVRAKSTLNMIIMSFSAIGIATIVWVLVGYSLAFDSDTGAGLIGGLGHVGLTGLFDSVVGAPGHEIPEFAFVMFQLTFAIVTVALLSGAIADRAKFSGWVVFAAAWLTFVYAPLAHWAFASQNGDGGWFIDRLGVLDFAGGTAVEVNSGASALALTIVIGARVGFRKEPMRPHNLPLVLLGAGLLWFGWFGFNAGSALTAGTLAATAMINTQVSTAAAAMSWLVFEQRRDGRPTTLGVASGAIAGAVAITPACGYVSPMGALFIGLIAGAVSAWAVGLKYRFGFDDSLDVVGVHGVGGVIGLLAVGFLGTTAANSAGADGLLYGGTPQVLITQIAAVLITCGYAFAMTYVIARVVDRVIGLRATRDDEIAGLDTTLHAESAYDFTGVVAGGAHSIQHRERS